MNHVHTIQQVAKLTRVQVKYKINQAHLTHHAALVIQATLQCNSEYQLCRQFHVHATEMQRLQRLAVNFNRYWNAMRVNVIQIQSMQRV